MNATGHMAVGILAGACMIHSDAMSIAIVALASLVPDIDHPKSTLGRYNPLAKFMKHRGFTHTFIGSALISLPIMYINAHICICVYAGCISHILADKLMSVLPGHRKFKLRLI